MDRPPNPSLEEFAREVGAALEAVGEARGLAALPDGAALVEQLYRQLADAPKGVRENALHRIAAGLLSPPRLPATWAEAAPRVRLTLRPRIDDVVESLRREAAGVPCPTLVTVLTPHLALAPSCLAGPVSLFVPLEALRGWGVSPEEVFGAAIGADAAGAGAAWLASPEHPGVLRSPWRDGRDAARMALPRAFALPVRGRPVAMAPKPGLLLVAGSEDEQGLLRLARLVERETEGGGRAVTLRASLLGADGESWEDWLPPPGHPAHDGLRALQAVQERRDYEEHAAAAEALAAAKGAEAAHMPPLHVLRSKEGGAVMTVTTWRSGRRSALPRADALVLRRGARTLGLASWEDVEAALPGALTRVESYPVRYVAEGLPEDWELGGLDLKPWGGAAEGGPEA